ncbi:MAG TPA: dihydrofolate reductase family protein [Chitinophagaceae bacterium]|nr:dihydrofolate reductase family protein [Chitinophagaceae bacterium]
MRKLKVQIHMSIDGFVAGPNGEIDWIFITGGKDPASFQRVVELAETSDTILLGRKMTREFVDHWENVADNQPDSHEYAFAHLLVNMRKIVFSKTEKNISGRNLQVENRDLVTVVKELKQEEGKDILVYGGASFVRSLIDLQLVDEYYIIRTPVAIGEGMRIFSGRTILQLQSADAYKNGKVMNKYLPV